MQQQLLGAVPPRKRRRPALSCIECRRRKVKCDRTMPCNHCRQSKSAVCAYKDDRRIISKAPPTPLSVNDYLASQEGMPGAAPQAPEAPSSDVNSLPRTLPSLTDGSPSEKESWITTSGGNTGGSPSEKNDPDERVASAQKQGELSNLSREIFSQNTSSNGCEESMSVVMGINFSTFEDVMIQDGDGRNTLRTKVFKNTRSTPIQDVKGTLCKSRFFGQSHWMFALRQFPAVCRFKDDDGNPMNDDASKDVRAALEKCKRMARAAKAERPIKWHMNPNFKDYIPPRDVADKLVALYLRTCESIYRIIHIPTFKREYEDYWLDPSRATTGFAVELVLIIAIGTCFYQEPGNEELRSVAQQWVYSAQSWTAGPFEKSRLNLTGIQIYCLLVLARQTNAVGGDLIWTASGALLRTAFSMGLHRDPKHFPKTPIYIMEMRRRIWATVLEMTIQTALEAGMPPLITSDDFDTEPPANIDDEELHEGMMAMSRSKPSFVYTQTSIQIMLVRSQCTRLKIVQLLNNFKAGPTYDEVLQLDRDIAQACNDASRIIRSYSASQPRPTALQRILLDILVRRYLLHIHIPFSVQSKVDPRYYFSRKVCLETALAIFFHSGEEDLAPDHRPGIVDDYTRLKLIAGGIFKDVVLHAATIIIVELITQLQEDMESGLPQCMQRTAAREPLYRAMQDIITLTAERIREGENNAKGHLFLSAAAAYVYALANDLPSEEVVPEAAKRSALHCLELLGARTKLHPVTPESDPGSSRSGGLESMEEPDYGFNHSMPDVNLEFEMPESWVFTGWEMNYTVP